jgi:2-(1,2-epoxy-1,2-dihydrophenyl)acetyl-CoA isomerase
MAYKSVLLEVSDGVATVTLNRPDKLNAFTTPMAGDLIAILKTVGEDPDVRCVLLTGAGRAFSAGQDLADPAMAFGAGGEGPDIGIVVDGCYNALVRTIRGLDKPVVAAVGGVAAGAGANLALACDIVLAGRSARFIQAFAKIGLVPDAGGTYMLPRLVGRARAFGLALLGDVVNGEQAEAWGLIWRCVDDDALLDEAGTLALALAAGPTRAYVAARRALDASATNTLDRQLDLERDLQQACGKTVDCREGVAAFTEKRPPRFSGC